MYFNIHSDSWDTYRLASYQPVLTFQNYQATCLLNTGSVTYDSSFSNELSPKSYQSFVSAGGEGNNLIVTGNFLSTDVYACTMQLYFEVTINVLLNKPRKNFPQLLFYPCNSTNKRLVQAFSFLL